MWMFILLVTLLIILWMKYNNKFNNAINKFPGPKTIPLLGNVFDLGTKPTDFVQTLNKLVKKYGDFTRIWIGPTPCIFVTDLDVIKFILISNKHINKTKNYELLSSIVGYGLVTSSGAKWKSDRRIIEPAFSFKIFDSFLSIFNDKLKIFTKVLDERSLENTFDITENIYAYSLESICEAAMGVEINAQTSQSKYSQAFSKLLAVTYERYFSVLKRNDFFFKLTPSYRTFCENKKVMEELLFDVLRKARQPKVKADGKCKPLIELLMEGESRGKFTDEGILDHTITFLIAGQNTVSASLCFAVYELGKNQKIQNNILSEINSVLGKNKDVEISLADVKELKYIELVFRETLRKYPSLPFFERTVEEDININGHFFPMGTNLNFFLYGIHNDERYHPNPELFNPDRFLNDIQPFTYFPFGLGPRNCIGQRYANLMFITTIAKLVMNYRISVPENFEVQLGLKSTLASFNGIQVNVEKR